MPWARDPYKRLGLESSEPHSDSASIIQFLSGDEGKAPKVAPSKNRKKDKCKDKGKAKAKA